MTATNSNDELGTRTDLVYAIASIVETVDPTITWPMPAGTIAECIQEAYKLNIATAYADGFEEALWLMAAEAAYSVYVHEIHDTRGVREMVAAGRLGWCIRALKTIGSERALRIEPKDLM